MAIIVEQEKKSVSWYFIIGSFLAFALVGLGAYYVFFATPQLLEKFPLPADLEKTKKFSGAEINVSGIVSDPIFRSLRQYVNPVPQGKTGRVNPFVPF